MAQKFLSKIMPSDVGGVEDAVQFVLGNGLKVVAELSDFDESVQKALMLHGLSQKIGDAAAGFSKALDYAGAFGAMQGVADNLVNGIWASRASAGTSDLVLALCNLKGLELGEAEELVAKMDEDQMAAVKKHPAVKNEMMQIKAARLKAAVGESAKSLDDLLDLGPGEAE